MRRKFPLGWVQGREREGAPATRTPHRTARQAAVAFQPLAAVRTDVAEFEHTMSEGPRRFAATRNRAGRIRSSRF
jgi:hypothetical protein